MRSLFQVVLVFGVSAWLGGSAGAQTGPLQLGGVIGFDGLLQNESVQKELKLTDEQTLKCKEVIRGVRQMHRPDLEKLQKLPLKESRGRLRELMQTVSLETLAGAGKVLRPEQTKRLKQIELQQRDWRVFSDSEVNKVLKLTDEQKNMIKKIGEDAAEERPASLQVTPRSNYDEALKKYVNRRKATREKAVAVLTPEQKKAWQELTGEPLEIKLERPLNRRSAGVEKKSSGRER